MSHFIAALPMYDWPENRAVVDAQWALLRDRLRAQGIDAPETLVRCNADMPSVPGGIRDGAVRMVAADPASLPPDDLDFEVLWRHPRLLFAQTCWGPLETTDLAGFVTVIGQPDYSGIEGGHGALYSSAIVMRRDDKEARPEGEPSVERHPSIPLELIRNRRFAFNSPDSMSGILALTRDLEAAGEGFDIFADQITTGGHRQSILAVAEGRADVATIDCRSWDLARRYEPAAQHVGVVGWTGLRKGLPFITARSTPEPTVRILQAALRETGMCVEGLSC